MTNTTCIVWTLIALVLALMLTAGRRRPVLLLAAAVLAWAGAWFQHVAIGIEHGYVLYRTQRDMRPGYLEVQR